MVTNNVMGSTSMTFILPKPTKGTFDGTSYSLPILICWKARQQRMLDKLPLSARTHLVLKFAMVRLITKASSWGWWNRQESSSMKLITESSIRVSSGGRPMSWTFCTICRQVFLIFLEDLTIVLPPTITLISPSGALGHSLTRQFDSWSLDGFSLVFSHPTNHYNFPCLIRAFICYFRSQKFEVSCPWSRWKREYLSLGLLFGSPFNLSGHVKVGSSLICIKT